jgi:hypothetical protein
MSECRATIDTIFANLEFSAPHISHYARDRRRQRRLAVINVPDRANIHWTTRS